MMTDVSAAHRRACDGFTAVVEQVGDRWDAPSPCTEWDARGVLEHVIGFHDQLVLTPLDAKPQRPKDDPVARWRVTADALRDALGAPGAISDERVKPSLVGVLATDVLVHTWDLARAAGIDVTLDPELTEVGYRRAIENEEQLRSSEMFGPAVAVPDDAPVQDKLLGIFGRDPNWTPVA